MNAKIPTLALLLALVSFVAPAGAKADTVKASHPDSKTTIWRIDQPNVVQPETAYPQIQFHPDDLLTITAGGCVQTGGSGKTWKSYTNPLGDKADHLYSGTIYIPDVIPAGASGYTRIGGQLNKPLHVPQSLPPTIKPSDLVLHLGYQDDKYSDNGYYSHDDGNFDQCKNVGAAWVEVKIVAGTNTGASQNAVNWTPYSKPFDIAWDWSNHVDVNGLPVNPYWAYQIGHSGQAPDFEKTCGGAFSGGNTINVSVLATSCSSQTPTADISNSSIRGVGGYCSGDPLSGHLDWYYVTYTGWLSWESWSGAFSGSDPFKGLLEDDDFNFQLLTTGNAGLTIANNETMGLEFRASETIDNFSLAFWKTLRDNAEKPFGSDDGAIRALVDGKFAVVTGLVGIDGVHSGFAEVHPVMSMAICIAGCTLDIIHSVPNANDSLPSPLPAVFGVEQTWVYFLTNYGSGGGCSQLEHSWLGLSDGSTQNGLPSAWYFISLPWEPGATSVSVTSHEGWAPQAVNGSSISRWGDWAYIGFQLAVPGGPGAPLLGASVDGQITIRYNGTQGTQILSAVRPPASVKGHAEEGVEWKDVQEKFVDPALRARLNEALRSAIPIRGVPHPHTVRITLSPNPGVAKALASVTPERRRLPTHDRPFVDAVQAKQRDDLEQIVSKLLPRPAPPKPPQSAPTTEQPILRPAPPAPPATTH